MREEGVATDHAPATDHGLSAENGRAGIDRHLVLERRVSLHAADALTKARRERAECHALIQAYVIADLAGLADHDPRAVIDEEAAADLRAGVDVDARRRVRALGDDARCERDTQPVQVVCDSIQGERVDRRVRDDDLGVTARGRVALERRLDVFGEAAARLGETVEELDHDLLGGDVVRQRERTQEPQKLVREIRERSAQRRFVAFVQEQVLEALGPVGDVRGIGIALAARLREGIVAAGRERRDRAIESEGDVRIVHPISSAHPRLGKVARRDGPAASMPRPPPIIPAKLRALPRTTRGRHPAEVSVSVVYSHSGLSSFENCPRQYQYRYLLDVEVETESVEAFVGKLVHEVLERLYQFVGEGRVPRLDQVLSRFDQWWNERIDPARVRVVRTGVPLGEYREIGLRCLTRFYRRRYPFDEDETLGLEEMVHFSLDEDGRYRMRGVIDRVARARDGVVEIHDYKTGRRVPSQERLDQDRQLALYQLGVSERFGTDAPVRLIWHYLAADVVRTSSRTSEQLAALRQQTMRLIDRIEAETAFEPRPSALCGWCEYREICPVSGGARRAGPEVRTPPPPV